MWARGHKKAFSDNSGRLVTSGPYTIVRNPMYLGTFLIGSGFVLVAWPWWVWPLFAGFFYIRFKKQILSEEAILEKAFGAEYRNYCQKTPRIFPSSIKMLKVDWKKNFNWNEVLSTKERHGLIAWPIMAFVLDCLQEKVIFGGVDLRLTVIVFISAYIVFVLETLIFFKKEN